MISRRHKITAVIGVVFLFFSLLTVLKGKNLVFSSGLETLRSLPYLTWSKLQDSADAEKKGVTRYDPALAYNGLSIFNSENSSLAYVIDMEGKILHTFSNQGSDLSLWQAIVPYGQGGFLRVECDRALYLIDWQSIVKWKKDLPVHHDVIAGQNGDIYTLENRYIYSPRYSFQKKIIDNLLVVLSKDGKKKKEISFAKMVSKNKSLFRQVLQKKIFLEDEPVDIFHVNKLVLLPREVNTREGCLLKKGDCLFTMAAAGIVGVADLEKEAILWYWGNAELDYPHSPDLLENGNFLIFDNGSQRKYSRVIELNPLSGKIEWEYKANSPKRFFTQTRGHAQRLPNGNTLITESEKGRVFEVTPDKEIVWEFFSPEIKDDSRATIYRMVRIINPQDYRWAKECLLLSNN